ncbi:glutathione S-transferase family protein [Leisingera aquaemixtae]|uniref:glutathione S-transferase family protein n=1 Tax=Leisingera aquaemixtae TaxID=1396826 RepID=UPI001C97CC98|nr:glutathione S-transferase family protein [Leisingera aquaemixtae]MBY6069328.1 glutathione S-transferase family protein [Leisingera aquaemixtae]
MIDLYGWTTGNTYRVLIALEETGLPYRTVPVNLRERDQDRPGFLALNPMGQVPLIIDSEGPCGAQITLSQSMAILLYLAEKSGQLLPAARADRAHALETLSLVMTDLVAPVNFGLSLEREEGSSSALAFGEARAMRALAAIEQRLDTSSFLGGGSFGAADCAAFPMIHLLGTGRLKDLPATRRWHREAQERAAVQRALAAVF